MVILVKNASFKMFGSFKLFEHGECSGTQNILVLSKYSLSVFTLQSLYHI